MSLCVFVIGLRGKQTYKVISVFYSTITHHNDRAVRTQTQLVLTYQVTNHMTI